MIGCGSYANNAKRAASCTGNGELIRHAVAHDLHSLVAYRHLSLNEARHTILDDRFSNNPGTGGWIAIDREGNVDRVFNTAGMYRDWIRVADSVPHVAIYAGE